MSNEAYLIATDIPGPVGVDFDTHVGYDPGRREVIANAPLAVPVYWLALFEPSHLVTLEVGGEDEDVTVPSLVAELAVARRLLRARRDALAGAFPEFQPTWERFAEVVDGLGTRFIKVNLQELWDLELEPDDFLPQLEAALRWFETQDEDDFGQLLEVASIERYDERRRTFPGVGDKVPRAFHLRGYAFDDSSWDNESHH